MKRKSAFCLFMLLAISFIFVSCGKADNQQNENHSSISNDSNTKSKPPEISLSSQVNNLTDGLSAIKYEGTYGFDEFLSRGGASSDAEVVSYLIANVFSGANGLSFDGIPFGCSTISAKDENDNVLFGRNFDWNTCNAMIVQSVPENGYASISTVNTAFINMSGLRLSSLSDNVQAIICLYAPLDGMNEKGLTVSVNMIQDSATISQNTDKPDITTTTAIRLLLDKAATVDEAVTLLEQYDMHASMGYMMHFAIADRNGNSVVVEYVNNEMIVTETPVVTNFYLAEGDKHGIGTQQSHERYDILMKTLSDRKTLNMDGVRDALSSVSKKNFGEFESTEWSVVFNQSTGEVHYYHRENYSERFIFSLGQEG